ncbi:MAG TPA: MgtC/SapB family protein [Candidatus Nanoarchaeia archaeon]|nr:MgtC/SapB family protein [Candidatus Nanoarchaeia archaeon]
MEINLIVLRLLPVLIGSLFFGLIRQKLHKPISFGTFTFVSFGSCALALLSLVIPGGSPLLLVGSIVTGIGFLGAGALMRTPDKTLGFTSASTIWLFAIFGVVVGLGEYLLGSIIYGVSFLIIVIDGYLEEHSIGAYQKKMVITTNKLISTSEFDKIFLSTHRHKMLGIDVNKAEEKMVVTFMIEGTKQDINNLSKDLLHQPWLVSCKVE